MVIKSFEWLKNPKRLGLLYIVPLEILLNLIGMFPFIVAIYISFTDWTPITGDWWDASFIGTQNYFEILFDNIFINSVLRTLGIVIVCITIEFLLGLILALLFLEELVGKRILTSIAILPMMFMPAVTGYVFYMAFQSSGQINLTLSLILGSTIAISWLSDPMLSLFAIMITDIWQWTPFMFLVLFSGLIALPPDPVNSARILGGSRWQIFRDVELPLLKPVIFIALLLRAIEAFKMFDIVFIITKGGPGYATQTLSVFLYEEGFKFLKMAYVTAGGLIIMLLVAIVSWFAVKPILRRVV